MRLGCREKCVFCPAHMAQNGLGAASLLEGDAEQVSACAIYFVNECGNTSSASS